MQRKEKDNKELKQALKDYQKTKIYKLSKIVLKNKKGDK